MSREHLTFSQSHGYEELPQQLGLEILPLPARRHIWNTFYLFLKRSRDHGMMGGSYIGRPWNDILRRAHSSFDHLALDEWNSDFRDNCGVLRGRIERDPFNKVFDLIQFILRDERCPFPFIMVMKRTFADCRLAYTIDTETPPTILPVATKEEGKTVIDALQTLRQAGLNASAVHLKESAECPNGGDWAGSIRESIHAVESVARRLDPRASKSLGAALKSLERRYGLHPTLKSAFGKLYGYTSSEEGIRHSRLKESDARVGQNEAVFMLSACAAFTSYLCRAAEDS